MTRLALFALLLGCGSTAGPPPTASPPSVATAYTTRLAGEGPEQQAIAIAQAVYAATREDNAAGAVILSPQDPALAYTAMHRITHMPVNAPLLYLTVDGELSPATREELRRLRPDGVVQDAHVQVYVIGTVHPDVLRTLRDDLRYEVRQFAEDDPVRLAGLLDSWQAALKADHPDEVVISALDHPDGIAHGLGPMGWNAHKGRGFAWVTRDGIPDETRRLLEHRNGPAYMYLTGDEQVISAEVAEDLAQYGLVRRVAGPDPAASSVVNAGYKDFGRNFGWWVDWEPREFGWGIAQSGHNFVVGDADDPLSVIPAAVLGHMGKHGPILLVADGQVPDRVRDYLELVRPGATGPAESIVNHGWIIGTEARVPWSVQREIDLLLRPADVPTARTAEAR